MALTGEEIRQRLNEFAARWGGYQGSERRLLELNRKIVAGEVEYRPFD